MVHNNKIKVLHYVLGYDSSFSVNSIGHSGDLALFWRASFNCQIINYSTNHITVERQDANHGNWRITGYYGYPEGGRRRAAWDFLQHLSSQFVGLWCIFGDFNDILDDGEKRG